MIVARRLVLLGSAVLLTGSLAACGSDTTAESTPTPTPTSSAVTTPTPSPSGTGASATCAALDNARLALADVKDVNILQEGTNAFKSSVSTFEQQLEQVLEAARSDFATEADAVKQAKASFDSAVQELGDSPSVSSVQGVASALRDLTSSFGTLTDAMDDAC
jgi:hypothetical protein